jgi:prepilin-type N-terminal cleavage/methylation domain-containing protein
MKRGFTLIELLVVIAIIGILASIVLVSVNSARNKGTAVRTLAEVAQLRSAFEQGFTSNGYSDLVGSAGHNDVIATTGPNMADINTLLCGIGKQGSYPSSVTGDVTITCDSIPNLHSGVIIYSNNTGFTVQDYGIYATTTQGYVCTDSFGNSAVGTTSIPAYAALPSPTTALCR